MHHLRQSLGVLGLAEVEYDVASTRVDVLADAVHALLGRPRHAVAVDHVLAEVARVPAAQVVVQGPLLADVRREGHGPHNAVGQLRERLPEALDRDPDRDPAVAQFGRAPDRSLRAAADPERRPARSRRARSDLDPGEGEIPALEARGLVAEERPERTHRPARPSASLARVDADSLEVLLSLAADPHAEDHAPARDVVE